MPRTEWETLLDPPCQGILMVTLPQCHYSGDQALSRFYCQKSCLKITLSQGNWYPQPHSESNGFQVFQLPCFSLSRQIMGWSSVFQYECELSFNALMSAVSVSVHVCVFRARRNQESAELSSCSPPTASDPLSYPPIIVFCYLACLSGRHCENPSRLCWDGAWLNVLAIAANAFLRLESIAHLPPFSSPLSSTTCTCLYYLTM